MIDSAAHGESALRYIKNFEYKYGQELLNLAYYAALPVVINADLIHLLRINFFLDPPEPLPFTAEADLLLSSLCYDIGDGLYEIAPNIRNILLQRLVKEYSQERVREIATLLWQFNDRYASWGDRPELERAQQLTALNFLDPLKAKQWLVEAEESRGPVPSVERAWFVAMWKEIERIPEISTTTSQFNLFGRDLSELKLLYLDEGMREAEVVEWFVKEGDVVKLGQTVVKLETDTTVIEVPARITGQVSEILVKSGQTAKVGDVLANFDASGARQEESQVGVSKEFNFSELLRQFRIHANMTQQALADKRGIHRRTIAAWERGEYLPKTRESVLELAGALSLDIEDTDALLQASLFLIVDTETHATHLQVVDETHNNVEQETYDFPYFLVRTRSMCRGVSEAELQDIAQEAWISFSNKLMKGGINNPKAYIVQIIRRKFIDYLRRELRHSRLPTISLKVEKLDGTQLQQLRTALLSAYSSREMLSQMVLFKLNKNLDAIVPITHLQGTIDSLIHAAEAEKWVMELVMSAHEFKPDDQMLKDFYERYMLGRVAEIHLQEITLDTKPSETQELSRVEDNSDLESLLSGNINQSQREIVMLNWPGPDDDLVIDAMLNDTDSHHWSKCQTFVNKLVLKLASNFSADMREDIAQNAMFSIVRYLPNFKRECKLTMWIVQVVKSRIADAGRIQQTAGLHQVLFSSDSDEDKENEAYNSKISSERTAEEESILREELREAFKDLLGYLSVHAKSERNIRILEMHIAGFSQEEIASKLDMPAANVGYIVRSTQRFIRERAQKAGKDSASTEFS